MVYLDALEKDAPKNYDKTETTPAGYVSLHQHTEFSLLDGSARIKDLVSRAKELNMTALAITDHGSMFGVVKFYKECKKQGIKPIIGCEVYTAERNMEDKEPGKDRPIGHLILLVKNEQGYKNLIKIVSKAYIDGFYYKPRTDKKTLKQYSDGLVCLSGCLAGKTQRLIVQGDYEGAKKEASELKEIFQDDFYLEIQNHYQDDDIICKDGLERLSKELDMPIVATNDGHYVTKDDATAQEMLMCMQTQTSFDNPNHMKFNGPYYYLKSQEEMEEILPKEYVEKTAEIADKCNFDFQFGKYNIPAYDIPEGYKSARDYFRYLCREGFKEKYPNASKEIEERLEFEMQTIENMGFVEYFLIVWDFINYAKQNGIPVGPGRGSAAGSIVAHCLSITNVDPIQYNLFFERFLNPERVSMPDIDIDFCIRRRNEVIEYVRNKYGTDHVCQIGTSITMGPKMAVRDVARTLSVPYAEANDLAKMIPDDAKTIEDAISQDADLKAKYKNSPMAKEVLDMAIKLENLPRNSSVHAAGVVIAPEPVDNFVPLMDTKKGIATQYTMTEIEELGLLKMDFLALRNLTVIQDTVDMIKKNHGIDIDLDSLDYKDANVYELLSKGKTVGIFQLESKGITDFFRKLKPTCIEDVIAGVALYRPGPMDSIPRYLQNKRNPKQVTYLHESLSSILDVTYGCIVYQEEVMQIVQKLAGYSFARADLVRRAMSKKKADVMEEEKQYFIHGKTDSEGNIEIPGCVRNGIPQKVAEEIFSEMESFAQYAFNKSHATAYALITYQTAWLKYYFPSEFMAALMTSESSDPEHLSLFIREAKKMNATHSDKKIKVLPPSVNTSGSNFIADKDGNIYFGLSAIKGVGSTAAEEIVQNSPYDDIFALARNSEINAKALESLISCGACKELSINVSSGLKNKDIILKSSKKTAKDMNSDQITWFDSGEMDYENPAINEVEEYAQEKLLALEKEFLGTYITGHPMNGYKTLIKENTNVYAEELPEADKSGIIAGMVVSVKPHYTKAGEKMLFIEAEDINDTLFDVVVFPRTYEKYHHLINEGEILVFIGNISDGSVLADKIQTIGLLSVANSSTKVKTGELHIRTDKPFDEIDKIIRRAIRSIRGTSPIRIYKNDTTYLYPITTRYDSLTVKELKDVFGEQNVKWYN